MSIQLTQYSASDVARWFIAWSDELDAGIDNLKLQKLLYFAQGHFLAQFGRPLFDDEIKAWAPGPMVPVVWHEYERFGTDNIPVDVIGDDFNWDDYVDINEFLVSIYNTYGKFAGWALRTMTYREPPWQQTFDGPGDEKTIPLDDIKSHFMAVA